LHWCYGIWRSDGTEMRFDRITVKHAEKLARLLIEGLTARGIAWEVSEQAPASASTRFFLWRWIIGEAGAPPAAAAGKPRPTPQPGCSAPDDRAEQTTGRDLGANGTAAPAGKPSPEPQEGPSASDNLAAQMTGLDLVADGAATAHRFTQFGRY